MSWKPVANGVKSPVISQNGGQFITITKFGQLKIWSTKAESTADFLLEQVLKKLSLLGELTKDVQL